MTLLVSNTIMRLHRWDDSCSLVLSLSWRVCFALSKQPVGQKGSLDQIYKLDSCWTLWLSKSCTVVPAQSFLHSTALHCTAVVMYVTLLYRFALNACA